MRTTPAQTTVVLLFSFLVFTSESRSQPCVAGDGSYCTGFEAPDFAPGFIFGQSGWNAFSGSFVEGHVDTANPFAGSQHLRISRDDALAQGTLTGAFSPDLGAQPAGAYDVSVMVNLLAVGGADYDVVAQAPSQGLITARVKFDFQGSIYVADDLGNGLVFIDTGASWSADAGTYKELRMEIDGVADSIDYYWGGSLIYSSVSGVFAGTSVEQVVLLSDNRQQSFEAGDFDNLSVHHSIGACCFSEGTCDDGLTVSECNSSSGDWQGPGSDCTAGGCPPTVDGDCTVKLTALDAAEFDQFGISVAISGDTAVIGAVGGDDAVSGSGSAYVSVRSGATWMHEAELTALDAAPGDLFGFSVSVSSDTAVIGAVNDNSGAGSAYVFVRSGANWTQQAKLTALDAAAFDGFGGSVSVAGNTVVVGASSDDDVPSNSGSAYVFVRSGTTWTQQQKLTAQDAAGGDRFGFSVSVSGDTAVISATGDDDGGSNSGSAYTFTRSGTTWTQQDKLVALDDAAGDDFGYSVSISGDTVVIGARSDDDAGSSSGSAYVFVRSGTIWTQQAKLTAMDAFAGDSFGTAVSVSGEAAVISANADDDGGTNSGSAYVFVRSGTTWTEQLKLTAADAAAQDAFGQGVAITGYTAIVGVQNDDDAGLQSGSAYLFEILDTDGDGIADACDNCVFDGNGDQDDADTDGLGDVCDPCTDTDDDGWGDPGFPANTCDADNCLGAANPTQADSDNDGFGDACDICPAVFNPSQADTDCNTNGTPDECEIVAGTSRDCQPNGIPDECELFSIVEQDYVIPVNPPLLITHNNPFPVSHTFNVPAGGFILDVDVDLTASHGSVADLGIAVMHGSTTVALFDHQCGSEDLFNGTVWSDEGGPISCTFGHVGTFQPFSPLSAFDGQDAAGDWTLFIVDTVPTNDGQLLEWSLHLTTLGTDNDPDADGLLSECDNCPDDSNAAQDDADGDGVGDTCDNCPAWPNASQSDSDDDGYGDFCDFCPGLPDGDVETFSSCMFGPDVSLPPICGCADFDEDGDADLLDFAEFQTMSAD